MHCHQCRGPINNPTKCDKCNFMYCCHACKMKDDVHKKLCGHCGTFVDDFEVRDTEDGRGYGVFSKKQIKQGKILFVEKPVTVVNQDIKSNYIKQQVMLTLHPRPAREHTLTEKIHYNTIDGQLYLNASFINHECMPNTQYYYMEQFKLLVVIAMRDIDIDQEITISYLDRPYIDRKQLLFKRYDFECRCKTCANKKHSELFTKLGICYNIITDEVCVYENSYKSCHKILEILDALDAPMLYYLEVYKISHKRALENNDGRHLFYHLKVKEYETFFDFTFT